MDLAVLCREKQRIERALALEKREAEAKANDPQYDFECKVGISPLAGKNEVMGEHLFKMGATMYKTNSAEHLYIS